MRKFGICVAALACMIAQPAMAEIGRVKNVTAGGVQVIRDGQSLRANSGFKLEEGDIILTSRGQRVGVTFLDNTRMAIGANSRVRLDEYRYDRARQTGRSTTYIQRGTVGIDSGNITRTGRDRMRVRTPTSTLGVRGTTFVVEVG